MKPFAGHSAITLEEAASRHEVPGAVPKQPMDPEDTAPMETDIHRRPTREMPAVKLPDDADTATDNHLRPYVGPCERFPADWNDDGPTVVVDKNALREWAEHEDRRRQ